MFEQGMKLKAIHGPDRVCDFSLGNPDLDPPPVVLDALAQEAARTGHMLHSYMPNAGLIQARTAVAGIYARRSGLPFTPDDIVMSSGAAGAMNIALKSILEPGDEVIALVPYFAEYVFYVDNHAGVFVPVETDEGFLPVPERIRAAIGPRTRAMIINSPNNPSGRMYSEETLRAVVAVLAEASARYLKPIYLISDEPYRSIVFDGRHCPSPLGMYPETLVASSSSKDLSMAGERIGHLAISPACRFREDLAQATIFANRILGFVNANALMQRMVARLPDGVCVDVEKYQRRRDRLAAAMIAMGYELVLPEGAFYLFPKSPLADETVFCSMLLDELIIVVPGSGFGRRGYFRLSFAVEDAVIERALPGLARAITRARKAGNQ